MKIRYITVCYTLFMLVIMMLLLRTFSESAYTVRDMVYYNEQSKLIEQELRQEKERTAVEEQYSCRILFFSDADYEQQVNELQQSDAFFMDYYEDGAIAGKVAWEEAQQSYDRMKYDLMGKTIVLWSLVLCGGYLLLAVIFWYFIRPFQELEDFSARIAKGNFDLPLPVHKNHFFGAFTESFDIMREELKKAKENEYQANRSKRELVAELSHDIKTPVSTIKAVCEVMQLKETNQDTLDKVGVIAAKADTIDHLIGNMFHAALEELEALKIEPAEESSLCIAKMFEELKYYGDIAATDRLPECLIWIDRLRLEQVIDNIVSNSYKYAKTTVVVKYLEQTDGIRIKIQDAGPGVPEEEMALITEKYYRGSNAKGKNGSGLGLYLSKLFMEQMQGGLECYNENGFVVELFVRKV